MNKKRINLNQSNFEIMVVQSYLDLGDKKCL